MASVYKVYRCFFQFFDYAVSDIKARKLQILCLSDFNAQSSKRAVFDEGFPFFILNCYFLNPSGFTLYSCSNRLYSVTPTRSENSSSSPKRSKASQLRGQVYILLATDLINLNWISSLKSSRSFSYSSSCSLRRELNIEELFYVCYAKLEAIESRWLINYILFTSIQYYLQQIVYLPTLQITFKLQFYLLCHLMMFLLCGQTKWRKYKIIISFSVMGIMEYSNNVKLLIGLQIRKIGNMEKIEGTDTVSDSEQQFLQPISKFYPPNQLISKNYAPDQKPILKLMKLEKPEIITNSEIKRRYKTTFDCDDTLGYQYSYALNNEVVFLKFNNQNYFRYRNKNKCYKFLAGLFLPLDRILSLEVKNSKNVYKTLPDIQCAQYKLTVQDSFPKNCKFSNSKTLKFSSNYESGNLFIAIKKKQYQYDLILQNDINSKGNTQWFNFAVQFHQEGTYRFNILNFTKSYSQYEDGMRIVFFSFKDHEMGLGGWMRGCNNIRYEQSEVRRQEAEHKYYSCLKFQYVCCHSTDRVIFSYFYPYTSLDLQKFLKKVQYRKINVHMKLQKTKICQTLSGLPIYVVSIQHKKSHTKSETQTLSNSNLKNSSIGSPRQSQNKSIIIMARQHPGQTQGSFITEGMIDILMENGQLDYLKRNIDFHIFPMINADGVLYGNYRTNLSGADLNRVWRNPKKEIHPEVYYIKKYLNLINKQSPIALIIDLHGHSKSLNSFFYGNPPKKDILANNSIQDSRIFPYICSKKIKQISFNKSTFSITEDKKNSARVVLSEMFPKAHVYTLENSFHGWKKDHNAIHEYTPQTLRKIGRELVITFLEYDKICEKNPQIKQKWMKEINQLKIRQENRSESEGGSDSQAEFQLIQLEDPFDKIPLFENEGRSLFDSKRDVDNIMKRQSKDNFVARNLMMKTQIYHRSYKYNRKLIGSEEAPSFIKQKRQQKQLKSNEISVPGQGFLSIVKIKTNSTNSGAGYKLSNSEFESLQKHMQTQNQINKQNIIDKLKRKKIRIQQAVHSSSGMKTFLRTMGIPLEKKLF